jgi:hypothetical protein
VLNRRSLFSGTLFLLLTSVSAWGITPPESLKNPAAHSGRHVEVSGMVQNVIQKTSRRGNDYETFEDLRQRLLRKGLHLGTSGV